MKKISERINYFLPLPDARKGYGYGAVNPVSKAGIGAPTKMTSTYPYDVDSELEKDAKDYDDEELGLTHTQAKKLSNKVRGGSPVSDPFPPKYGARQAYVNGATRLDLGLSENMSLFDAEHLLEYMNNNGALSPILMMGNGAGIFKTATGKTIGGVGWASPRYSEKDRRDKVYASLKDLFDTGEDPVQNAEYDKKEIQAKDKDESEQKDIKNVKST
tara:strand:- start:3185 stop:3832 length:648 start_codon:yes stop_codon:yes gene_type:complete